MKKFNVMLRLFTGNYNQDGNRIYDKQIEINTDNIEYIYKVMNKNFSDIDIHIGNVKIFDINGNFTREISRYVD